MDGISVSADACDVVHAVHDSAVAKLSFGHRRSFQWAQFAYRSCCAHSVPGYKPGILTASF